MAEYSTGLISEDNAANQAPTWSDYGRTVVGGAESLGTGLAAAGRYMRSLMGDEEGAEYYAAQERLGGLERQETMAGMSEGARARLESSITDFSDKGFWSHPFSATALKVAGMTPALAAGLLPGGAVTGVMAKTLAIAGAGGAINTAQMLDEYYQHVDSLGDEELQKQSATYRGLRGMFGESEARRQFDQANLGAKPLLTFLVSSAAGALTPAAQAGRALAGGAGAIGAGERGLLGRVGLSAGEGALGGAMQSGSAEAAVQHALVQGEIQPNIDTDKLVGAVLEGGAIGAAMGAPLGIPGGLRGKATRAETKLEGVTPEVTAREEHGDIEVAPENTSEPPKRGYAGQGSAPPPNKNVKVGDEQNKITEDGGNTGRFSKKGALGRAAVETGKRRSGQEAAPETPEIAPEIQLALNTKQDEAPAPPKPEEIVQQAVQQKLAQPQPEAAPQPGDVRFAWEQEHDAATDRPTGPQQWFYYRHGVPGQSEYFPSEQAAREAYAKTQVQSAPLAQPDLTTKVAQWIKQAEQRPIAERPIPEGANGARDLAGPVYIDPQIPKEAHNFIKIHETVEGGLMSEGMPYDQAHKLATLVEKHAVESAGIPWDSYEHKVDHALAVTEHEPLTPQPADKHVTTEEALGKTPAPTGRILEDVSPQGKEARKQARAEEAAQVAQMQEEVEAAEKARAKKAGENEGKGHYTKAVKEAKARKEDFAEKILVEYRGKPEETPEQTIERARAIVAAAKEAKVEPDKKLVGSKVSGGRLVLTEAANLVKAADAGKPKGDMLVRVTRFRKREADAHAGEVKAALEERRAEGDELKRVKQKEVEGIAKAPEAEHTDATEVTGEGSEISKSFREENQDVGASATEHGRKATTIKAETEEATLKTKEGGELKVERAKAASDVRKVTPEVAAEIAKKYGALGAKAAATSKARSLEATPGKKLVGEMTPKEREVYYAKQADEDFERLQKKEPGLTRKEFDARREAGLAMVKGMLKTEAGSMAEAAQKQIGTREAPQMAPRVPEGWRYVDTTPDVRPVNVSKIPGDVGGRVLGETEEMYARGQGRRLITNEQRALKTTTFSDLYNHLVANGVKRDSGFRQFIDSRLRQLVGNMPVHIVSGEEEIRSLIPSAIMWAGRIPKAYFDSEHNHIVMGSDLFNDPHVAARILVHEGAHGFTTYKINNDPKFAQAINILRQHAIDALGKKGEGVYGLTTAHEFIAELYSQGDFQRALGLIDISPQVRVELNRAFGPLDPRVRTLWDAFINILRKAIGLKPNEHTLLEAALEIGKHLEGAYLKDVEAARGSRWEAYGKNTKLVQFAPEAASRLEKGILESAADTVKSFVERPELQRQLKRPLALVLRTTDQIAQLAESYFGGNNPVRAISNAREKMHVYAQKLLGEVEPLIARVAELSKRYAGPEWDRFQNFVVDETMAGVHASVPLTDEANSHVHFAEKGVEHLSDVWSRAQHAKLREIYNSLPGDLKLLHKQMLDYFPKTQNDMALGTIQNRVLKALGHDDASLARRIFDKEVTDDDLKTLGDGDLNSGKQVYDIIKKASALAKVMGPYHPLMRRGDYVVRATLEVTAPKGATPVKDEALPTFDFKDRDQAAAWVRQQDGRTSLQSVWVDKNTGLTRFPDGTKVTKEDIDAEQRFRAQVQNRHVEFFETARDAQKAAAELESEIGAHRVKGVEHRQYEPRGRDADLQASQITSLLNSMQARSGWSKLSGAEKHFVTQALNELAIRSLGSTRIQSRRLPRRHVAGASTDILRNTYDYALSTSQHLAKLKYAPELENALKEMDRQVGSEYGKEGTLSRSTIAHEIHKRLDQDLFDGGNGAWHAWTKRLVTASFLDKLFGPSNSVINATQPAMLTMPVLGARHGVTRAFTEMRKAYSDVGGLSVVQQGLQASVAKAMRQRKPVSFLEDIISRATRTGDEAKALRYLSEVGSISPDSGLEVSELLPARRGFGGKVDVPLHYLEGIARQMPRAIEAINRTTTALAAYRLERAKGASHDEAVAYAQKVVNETQFLYSPTNRAPWMNHPLAKLTLQFKQYAQGVYHLIGSNIGKAMSGATREERAEAVKTLLGIAATHTAMAGVLGLPTEPFKYLLMGANAAGLTNFQWQDVEDQARQIANGLFGKGAGEAITKGLPRLLGVDISSRVGLDSLTSFGEPRSQKEADVKSWLWDTLSGAPVSLIGDWVKASNQLMAGNFEKAAELGVPIKTFADSMRAYRQATEGKKSQTSGKQTMTPYTPYEAAVRTLGFTPAREAEEGARASYFYRNQARDKQDRQNLMNQWVNASPSEKSGAWSAITHWNQSQRPEQRIKMGELTSALRNREKAATTEAVPGIKTNKRDKYLMEKGTNPYFFMPEGGKSGAWPKGQVAQHGLWPEFRSVGAEMGFETDAIQTPPFAAINKMVNPDAFQAWLDAQPGGAQIEDRRDEQQVNRANKRDRLR